MRFINDLKPMRLYSDKNQLFIPIDVKNKRKGSAILLLTSNTDQSQKLMNLPYLWNPMLFQSYYVSKNVTAYIDHEVIDDSDNEDIDKETVTEALIHPDTSDKYDRFKGKFIFKEGVSKYEINNACKVFNANTLHDINQYLLAKVDHDINIYLYKNINDIHKLLNDKKFNAHSTDDEIHVVCKSSYNNKDGTYEQYLKHELCWCLIKNVNIQCNPILCYYISAYFSGQWKNKSIKNSDIPIGGAKTIDKLIANKGYAEIRDIIKTNDLRRFYLYTAASIKESAERIFGESTLSSNERNELPDSEFGIPKDRKFPLNDESHVRAAINMFNHVGSEQEKELAENIKSKMKKFDITDIHVSDNNRFSKYYLSYKQESTMIDGVSFKTPQELYNWMHSNIKYKEFTKLMTADNVLNSKSGSCHDQVVFESKFLKSLVYKIGYCFFIEYDENNQGGITHTLLFYYLNENDYKNKGPIYVFENAWSNKSGITKYSNEKELTSTINKWFDSGLFGNKNKFNNIGIYNKFSLPDSGIDLNKYVEYFTKGYNLNESVSCNPPSVDLQELKNNNFVFTEDFLRVRTEDTNFITFFENVFTEDASDKYDSNLRKYLYKQRIKSNKELLDMYTLIRGNNSFIKKTYLRLDMYSGFNMFVDLSYYHSIFMQNNVYKMDKGINIYWDFLNRLLDNKEIDSIYGKRTIFIPVDDGSWNNGTDKEDVFNYRATINPISLIYRMIRTNPEALKREWGNKSFLFAGTKGYFRVDFNTFQMKDIARFKNNILDLMSDSDIIDELDPETNEKDFVSPNKDSSSVITAKVIDTIDSNTNIKIDAVAPTIMNSTIKDKDGTTETLSASNNKIDTIESINDDLIYHDNNYTIPVDDRKNSTLVFILSPHETSTLSTITNKKMKNSKQIDEYVKLK